MTDGFYLLRWRFEYADGKAPKYGMWSHPGKSPVDMAAFQTKANLAFAMIEGRHSVSREDKILAVCPGDDFCNFQWVAEAHFNPFGGGVTQQNVVGMKLVSRYDEVTVFASGRVTQDARTAEDQKYNYASY
jgi:hypothetical protein